MQGRAFDAVLRAAVAGGLDLIQVREKDLDAAQILALARGAVEIAKGGPGRCRVVVNDRLDVALAARAAGVHLPAEGFPVADVRRVTGTRLLVGRSIHSLAEGREAARSGADYVIFGPVFETPGKAAYGPAQGAPALRKVAESVRVPVWAIGGITPESAGALRGIPIAGVAAIRAIASADDPAAAVRALRAALEGPGAS